LKPRRNFENFMLFKKLLGTLTQSCADGIWWRFLTRSKRGKTPFGHVIIRAKSVVGRFDTHHHRTRNDLLAGGVSAVATTNTRPPADPAAVFPRPNQPHRKRLAALGRVGVGSGSSPFSSFCFLYHLLHAGEKKRKISTPEA
jgi:hypothetical protein